MNLKHTGNSKNTRANSVNPDVAAHNELPHLDLLCLQLSVVFSFGAIGVNKILQEKFFYGDICAVFFSFVPELGHSAMGFVAWQPQKSSTVKGYGIPVVFIRNKIRSVRVSCCYRVWNMSFPKYVKQSLLQ